MIPQSVMIGLVVAVVGYFLQQRSWRNSKREEIRQKEFDECMKIIESLARAFDKRIVATSEFISLVDKSELKEEDRQKFKECVYEWMHEFSSFKAKIYHYFGREKMLEFENVVHFSLREVSEIASRTNRLGKDGLSLEHLKEHNELPARMDIARYRAFRFLRDLNEMVGNEEVGRTSLYNNIEVGSLDLISRTYLIQRLLGMKS